MGYQNILPAIAAVVAPYFGSDAFTNPQVPQAPSFLEKLVSASDGQNQVRNCPPLRNTLSVTVPFYRGIAPDESKKSPAPPPQHIDGHRTPRCSYRKVAGHR